MSYTSTCNLNDLLIWLKESSSAGVSLARDTGMIMAQPTENTQPGTSGRSKRKIVVVLDQCLCGEMADPASESSVVECKQTGCETRWASI
jgi:hypothetical protein